MRHDQRADVDRLAFVLRGNRKLLDQPELKGRRTGRAVLPATHRDRMRSNETGKLGLGESP